MENVCQAATFEETIRVQIAHQLGAAPLLLPLLEDLRVPDIVNRGAIARTTAQRLPPVLSQSFRCRYRHDGNWNGPESTNGTQTPLPCGRMDARNSNTTLAFYFSR